MYMGEQKRDIYWDIIKGLGIIAIVLGHIASPYSSFVYLYHLSLFFFVSGFLYKDTHSIDVFNYTSRKLRELYLPLIKYGVAFILLHNIFIKLNIYSKEIDPSTSYYSLSDMFYRSINEIINANSLEGLAGALWFVTPLFVAMLIFCIIRNFAIKFKLNDIKKEIFSGIICLLLSLLGLKCFINHIQLTWRTDIALVVMPIVFIGYLFKIYNSKIRINWIVALLSICVLISLYKDNIRIDFANGAIPTPVKFILATFSGIYVNLFLGKVLMKQQYIAKFIAYLGKNSFHIMALHFLSFKAMNLIDVLINHKPLYMVASFTVSNTNWWVLNLLAGLLIPVLCVYLYELIRTKIVYLNGKRKDSYKIMSATNL